MELFFIATVVLACANADGELPFMPRLPASVISSGNFETIPYDKIVGGIEVAPNSLPFQISLQLRKGNSYFHICGGSVLDETTILTAAHCVVGISNANLRIIAGAHSLSRPRRDQQISSVASFTVHAAYDRKNFVNDIAMLKLAKPLFFSLTVQPINLPPPTSKFDPPSRLIATLSGWGTTSEGGSLSDVLISVNVPIVSDAACDAAYGGKEKKIVIYPSMLCAGGPKGGIDSCQGDSGGPLFTRDEDGKFVQHGIVSWGIGCARSAYPGVCTQVSYYLDWIKANQG